MFFLLLPLIFKPYNIIARFLPSAYLALWPIVVQLLGKGSYLTNILELPLSIIITRQMILKLFRFDLISLPIGTALFLASFTPQGLFFISSLKPILKGFLVILEPIILLMEIHLFMNLIRTFSRWMSEKSNEYNNTNYWEVSLKTTAVLSRIVVVVLTILCYIGTHSIIRESKNFLGDDYDYLDDFKYAITGLVVIQIISLILTIWKNEGIISECAMTALLAAIPILAASWTYQNLREISKRRSGSIWSLFSAAPILRLLAGGGAGSEMEDPLAVGVAADSWWWTESSPNWLLVLLGQQGVSGVGMGGPEVGFQRHDATLDQGGVSLPQVSYDSLRAQMEQHDWTRLSSPVVKRLVQSVLVQLYYLVRLASE